jgi:phage-related protein
MSSVDDRIVNMQFNNSQFQTGAADSTKSLQTLETTIAGMGKSTSGLDQMGSSVDGIRAKFSALQVAGVTAIATIVNKAVEAGLTLLKSMTLDPLLQGFQEYETNLNSIQTIMANTGVEIKVVNKYLDELNEYSDRTIYNFSQMAQNIGRFTAAGVELRTATDAIKGLANTAALSGSNVDQLNTAMYQMSQALSTGTIRLMDWNSLANAGMGGENIRNALMATNRTLADNGAAMDAALESAGNFRDSLQYGWLSAETFTKTMKVMAGTTNDAGETVAFTTEQLKKMGYSTDAAKELNRLSQASIDAATKVKTFSQLIDVVKESIGSGWAQVFENLFGNFNQASKLWTGVSETITGFVKNIFDSVNNVLESWRKLGGYQDLWDGFGNIFEALGNLLQPFVTAFQSLTPSAEDAGSTMFKVTDAFETFTGWLVTITDTLNILTPIITAVFSVFKFIGSVVVQVAQGLAPVVDLIKELAGGMSDLAAQGSEIGGNIVSGLLEGLDVSAIKTAVENFATSIVDWIKNALGIASPAAELVPVGTAIVQGVAQGISEGIRLLAGVLSTLIDTIIDVLPGLAVKLATVVVVLVQAIGQVLPQLKDAVISIIDTLLDTINEAVPLLKDAINNLLGAIEDILVTNIPRIANVITTLLVTVLAMIGTIVPQLITVGLEIILAIAQGLAENIPLLVSYGVKIVSALAAGIIDALGNVISSITDNFSVGISDGFDNIDWAVLLNAALTGGLIAVLIKLAKSIAGFVDNVTGPFAQLTDTLKQMQQTLKAQALMAIAIAIGVLTASLVALSLLDLKQLGQGLGAIAGLMALMLGSFKILNKIDPKQLTEISLAFIAISTSILILATAIAILGNLDLDTLGKGIGAIAISLAILVTTLKKMTGLGAGLPAAAAALVLMATAMLILSAAIAALGNLSLIDLAQGVGAMALALNLMVGALRGLAVVSAGAVSAGAGLLLVGAALFVMAQAIRVLGEMNIWDLAQGFGVVAAGLGLMVAALIALAAVGPTSMVAAGSLAATAGALFIMAAAIQTVGNMSLADIAKGILGLASAIALLFIAAALIVPPSPIGVGLAILGGTFLAIGAGAALLGVGLLAAASAFAIFATVGSAAIGVMVAGFTAFMALLPAFGVQIAAAVVTFIQTIAAAAPKLREAFGTILTEMLGTVRDAIPEFRKTAVVLITNFLKAVRQTAPDFGKTIEVMIRTGLRVIRDLVPAYVNTGMAVILGFLEGIGRRIDEVIDAGARIIVKLIRGIGDAHEDIVKAAGRALKKFLIGIDQWLDENEDDLITVGRSIAGHIVEGLTLGLISPEALSAIGDAAGALVDAIKDRFTGPLGFLMNSPSKLTFKWGQWIVDGLANGVDASIGRAVGATIRLANAAISAGNEVIEKFQRKASKEQIAAENAAARARLAEKQAKTAEKAASKQPKNKALEEAAKDARKRANKLSKDADKAQKAADAASQKVVKTQEFLDADNVGKGDILTAKAKNLSDRAIRALAEANAAAAAAKKATGKEKDKLKEEAEKAAKLANRLSKASRRADERAQKFYRASIEDRIDAIEAEKQARLDQEAFDASTDQQKMEILASRAEDAQKLAKAKQDKSDALVKQAAIVAKKDARRAQRMLDKAEALSAEAQDAADQADQALQDIDSIKGNTNSSGGIGTGTDFQLSTSALEDAASAIDRYTMSLQQAEEAAQSATPVQQFVQNNYSPEALDPTTVYRQTKNLLSASN